MSRHEDLATKTIDKVSLKLAKKGLPTIYDNWPHHVIAVHHNHHISVWCGGFDKHLEVAVLRKNGSVDLRYKERSFMTPEGTVNWVERFFKKKGRNV